MNYFRFKIFLFVLILEIAHLGCDESEKENNDTDNISSTSQIDGDSDSETSSDTTFNSSETVIDPVTNCIVKSEECDNTAQIVDYTIQDKNFGQSLSSELQGSSTIGRMWNDFAINTVVVFKSPKEMDDYMDGLVQTPDIDWDNFGAVAVLGMFAEARRSQIELRFYEDGADQTRLVVHNAYTTDELPTVDCEYRYDWLFIVPNEFLPDTTSISTELPCKLSTSSACCYRDGCDYSTPENNLVCTNI